MCLRTTLNNGSIVNCRFYTFGKNVLTEINGELECVQERPNEAYKSRWERSNWLRKCFERLQFCLGLMKASAPHRSGEDAVTGVLSSVAHALAREFLPVDVGTVTSRWQVTCTRGKRQWSRGLQWQNIKGQGRAIFLVTRESALGSCPVPVVGQVIMRCTE